MLHFRWKHYYVLAASIALSILLSAVLTQPIAATVESNITPLSPPQRESPRSTLYEFRNNMNLAYGLIMSAYKQGREELRFFYSPQLRERGHKAEEALGRAIKTLDLSDVPPAQLEDVGVESALLLKEILDRIPLPDDDDVPNAMSVERNKIDYWLVPGTEIAILKLTDGFNVGNFVFSKETVKRLSTFYRKVKDLPYQPAASEGFYEFYISRPGGLLPPKWSHFLPAWSNQLYFEQTIWQWITLVLIYILLIVSIVVTQRVLSVQLQKVNDQSSAWIGLSLPSVAFLSAFIADYLLDQEVNITGSILGVIKTSNLVIEYAAGAWFAFLLLNALGISLLQAKRFQENALEATMVRNGFRLIGILAGATVVAIGFTNIGISVAPLLASLGAGSLALSFGLQPYIQDTIGGITLFVNGSMEIGDFCEFGGVSGTVEDIGLRATMIRTRDRRLITIPNANVSSMLVNHSRRDKFLFDRQLELSGETPFTRISEVVAALYNRFSTNPNLDNVQVNVTSLSQEETIRLGLFGYVLTTRYEEYIQIQSALMLDAVTVLDEMGIIGKISAED